MGEVITGLAGPNERAECYRLCYSIYYEEMGMLPGAADHESAVLRDDLIDRAHVFYAAIDGTIVGSLAVLLGKDGFPPDVVTLYDIDRYRPVVGEDRMAMNTRFFVHPDHRASAVPFALIAEATAFQIQHRIAMSFADCQPHLLNLYRAIGFRPCAPARDKRGIGMVVPLVILTGDIDHLRAVGSPLLGLGDPSDVDPELAARLVPLLPDEVAASSLDDLDAASWAEAFATLSRPDHRVGMFDGFTAEEFEQLLVSGELIECHAGQHIITEAQGTRTVFVVLDGVVEVRHADAPLRRLGRGQPFGEIAMLLGVKRTADVVAATDHVRVIALSDGVVQQLIGARSQLAALFLLNLARTLAVKVAGDDAGQDAVP